MSVQMPSTTISVADPVAQTNTQQRQLMLKIKGVTGLEPTGVATASGFAKSTFTRLFKPGSRNSLSPLMLSRMRDWLATRGYTLDVDTLALTDSNGHEVQVGDDAELSRYGRAMAAAPVPAQQDSRPAATARMLPVNGAVYDPYVDAKDGGFLFVVYPSQHAAVECPPWLRDDDGAYALRIANSVMAPVLLSGDTVYVSTKRGALRRGELVVIRRVRGGLTAERPQEIMIFDGLGSDGAYRFTLVNAPGGTVVEISADRIESVHRVAGIQRDQPMFEG